MADLKACPFCGGNVQLNYSSINKRFNFTHTGLRNCAFYAFYIHVPTAGSLKEAAELWNRRVSDGRPD